MATSNTALQLAKDLWKQVNSGNTPDLERCQQIVKELEENADKAPSHKLDTFTKTLNAAQKSFRLQKRKSDDETSKDWNSLLDSVDKLNSKLQRKQKNEEEEDEDFRARDDDSEGPPSSASAYLSRLKQQKKEIYKNPPVLPPIGIAIEDENCPLPKRDKNGRLTFQAGTDKSLQTKLKEFHPNRTPEEVLRGGGFGGTYFRTIVSAVTNKRYTGSQALNDTVPDEWIHGLDKKAMLTSQTYNQHINKYKAKCGGSLGMWESSGVSMTSIFFRIYIHHRLAHVVVVV